MGLRRGDKYITITEFKQKKKGEEYENKRL